MKLKWKTAYDDHVPNHALGGSYREWFNKLGGNIESPRVDRLSSSTQASTDQGNVSHVLPSIHSSFWIRSEDENGNQLGGPHTPDFEKAARTGEAHEMAKRTAKALAATAVDVLTKDGLLKEVKKEFEDMKSKQTTK